NRPRKGADGLGGFTKDELDAVEFMRCLLELDPARRIPADCALEHPFLSEGLEKGAEGDQPMD
ncbi:hypothetical protein KC318_g4889, partial [Hortaea werneckii]